MRKLTLGLCLTLWLGLVACNRPPAEPSAEPASAEEIRPTHMPEFTLKDTAGREVSSASFQGKVLIVDIWATWCKPCEKEMPEFEKLQKKYGEQGFAVIGIALDTDPADVAKFTHRLGVTYTILMGTPEALEKWGGLEGLPTTFVVDRAGRVRKKVIGFEYPEEFDQAVRELL